MKVALLGFGVEGKSAYDYYLKVYPSVEFTIYDNSLDAKHDLPAGVEFVGGVKDFHDIDADIVVKTPAIHPDQVSTKGKVTSVTQEFFKVCPAPIIGVTGTKGKGTTCTLIKDILEAAGKKVWLVGNIGVSALDVIDLISPQDIVVYELSSFQLWDLKQSPQTAVVLLVEPDHLNVHHSMEEYVQAKSSISSFQGSKDQIIFHPTNHFSAQIAATSDGVKKRYQTTEGAYVTDEKIIIDDQIICRTNQVGLLGAHNLENICAAITAAWNYTRDTDAIKKAITTFTGLPHHTEKIHEINGISFYDDSFSSAPAATIAAIKSFSQPEIVIIGGADKQGDYTKLVNQIKNTSNIKKIILIGQTGPEIARQLDQVGETRFDLMTTKDFKEIIKTAYENAQSGDVVLLSPGCASFDMFNNFTERGNIFQKIVRSYE